MLVRFHGVRGSTPCHGDDIARYGGNTSCVSVAAAGEDPLLFDLGTGLRYFGLTCPTGEPFRGTCLLSHLHWDHVQGLPFFGPLLHDDTELVVYAPSEDDGRTAAEVLAATICPPLFPIGLDGFPGHDRRPRAAGHASASAGSTSSRRRCRTSARRSATASPTAARASPTSATTSSRSAGRSIADGVWALCQGVDLLIHDAQYTPAEFAQKSHWGHCTVEYAVWLAGEVGARRLALFHHDPSHDDDMLDRLAAAATACGKEMGVEVFAAREGLVVELGAS